MKNIVILTAAEVAACKRNARKREAFHDMASNGQYRERPYADRRRKAERDRRKAERASWKRGDY